MTGASMENVSITGLDAFRKGGWDVRARAHLPLSGILLTPNYRDAAIVPTEDESLVRSDGTLVRSMKEVRAEAGATMVYACPVYDREGALSMIDAIAMGKAIVVHRVAGDGFRLALSWSLLLAHDLEGMTTHFFRRPWIKAGARRGRTRYAEALMSSLPRSVVSSVRCRLLGFAAALPR